MYMSVLGKEFSYYEKEKYPNKEKLTFWEQWLYQLEIFHNIVVLPIARQRLNSRFMFYYSFMWKKWPELYCFPMIFQ